MHCDWRDNLGKAESNIPPFFSRSLVAQAWNDINMFRRQQLCCHKSTPRYLALQTLHLPKDCLLTGRSMSMSIRIFLYDLENASPFNCLEILLSLSRGFRKCGKCKCKSDWLSMNRLTAAPPIFCFKICLEEGCFLECASRHSLLHASILVREHSIFGCETYLHQR